MEPPCSGNTGRAPTDDDSANLVYDPGSSVRLLLAEVFICTIKSIKSIKDAIALPTIRRQFAPGPEVYSPHATKADPLGMFGKRARYKVPLPYCPPRCCYYIPYLPTCLPAYLPRYSTPSLLRAC